MTDKEVMQMALDALESWQKTCLDCGRSSEELGRSTKPLQALRARLAQPEQEPVAWMYPDDADKMRSSETFCTVFSVQVGNASRGVLDVPLYTAPPKKEWVGLTDDEIEKIFKTCTMFNTPVYFASQIEAKLKDKNT